MTSDTINEHSLPGTWISGDQALALMTAYEDFKARMEYSPREKNLANYQVAFFEEQNVISITFMAKRSPEEKWVHSGKSSFGRDIEYEIDKRSGKLLRWSFFR